MMAIITPRGRRLMSVERDGGIFYFVCEVAARSFIEFLGNQNVIVYIEQGNF